VERKKIEKNKKLKYFFIFTVNDGGRISQYPGYDRCVRGKSCS
jgi:hypothetical protein